MKFKEGAKTRVLNKTGFKCAYCGDMIDYKSLQIDHIIPKSHFVFHIKNRFKVPSFLTHLTENDVNHDDNLFPSCSVCNKWKSSNTLEEFRTEIAAQLKRANQYSANYRMAKKYGLIIERPKKVVFYFELLTPPENK